jgi:hypothetical protein
MHLSKRFLPVAALAALLAAPIAARAESEFSVVLQGGATKYNRSLASGTDVGAQYGLRLGFMPSPIAGLEVGYLGSQNNVKAVIDTGGNTQRLITNGVLADLRLNLLPGDFTPYVFGGYGLTNFKVANEVIASDGGLHGRTVSTIPFGGGLEGNLGAFKLGARFQYNYLLTDQLFRTQNGNVTMGHNTDFYGVSVDLGASFR